MPQNWVLYTGGYKEAGDLLLKYALRSGRQHVLVYPIIFLYRHYIELQLKEIIVNNRSYLGKSEPFPDYHNIDRLWEICKQDLIDIDEPLLNQLDQKRYEEILSQYDALGKDVSQFSQWDPDSQHFRYPVDKKGNPIVLDLRSINLRELEELMRRISGLLGGISVGAYEYLVAKQEMQSYE